MDKLKFLKREEGQVDKKKDKMINTRIKVTIHSIYIIFKQVTGGDRQAYSLL